MLEKRTLNACGKGKSFVILRRTTAPSQSFCRLRCTYTQEYIRDYILGTTKRIRIGNADSDILFLFINYTWMSGLARWVTHPKLLPFFLFI
jgi:hypothetical protein